MKPIRTPLRFLLPAAAILALGTVHASPGHSSASADTRSAASLLLSDRGAAADPDAAVSGSPYDNFGFATDGAIYQPVGDLDKWINRGLNEYYRHRQQRSNSRRYDDRYSRSYRGYYPNDPDDRNNPRHPGYIGPPGSYGRYYGPYRGHYNGHGYYPNDPDDRNNPSHPDYIGPPRRWR
ncbi:MAG: hypothetical protein ACO1TE_28275 [Prosthecobacter sp.]